MSRRETGGLTEGGRCKGCGKAQVRLDTYNGRLVEVPSPCRCVFWRRVNAVCRHCDEPVTGRKGVALYCDKHRAARRADIQVRHAAKVGDKHQRAYRERHREEINARAKASYTHDPATREARNAYKRRYRAENREKIRRQKERASLKNWKNPQVSEYQKRWRAEVAIGSRAPQRARMDSLGRRLCLNPSCDAVMHGREKLCGPCRAIPADERARGADVAA